MCAQRKLQARAEIAAIRRRSQQLYATQRRKPEHQDARRFKQLSEDILEEDCELWLEKHSVTKNARYTAAQRRDLRAWFDTLDRDGSSEIGIREMAQPLLATGIAMSALQVGALVRLADKDGSGEVGFDEFMLAARGTGGAGSSKILMLQTTKSSNGNDMCAAVSMERRKLLLQSVMGAAQEGERLSDDIERRWDRAVSEGDTAAAKLVYRDLKLLLRRTKRNDDYVTAVEQMTDFKQELRDVVTAKRGTRAPV